MGRPRIQFDKSKENKVLEMFKEGQSNINVAAYLEMSIRSFDRLRIRDIYFGGLIEKGLALSEAWWQEEGRQALENKDFRQQLWYMNMKNRFKWQDGKPIYALKRITGYYGNLEQKNKSIDRALAKGVVSVDEHNMLQNSLLAEAKILEIHVLEQRVTALELQKS